MLGTDITSDAVAIHDKADLLTALRSRVIIEQARGVLVARDRCTPDEAFDLLRRISHNDNITLQQLAQIISTRHRDSAPLERQSNVRPPGEPANGGKRVPSAHSSCRPTAISTAVADSLGTSLLVPGPTRRRWVGRY